MVDRQPEAGFHQECRTLRSSTRRHRRRHRRPCRKRTACSSVCHRECPRARRHLRQRNRHRVAGCEVQRKVRFATWILLYKSTVLFLTADALVERARLKQDRSVESTDADPRRTERLPRRTRELGHHPRTGHRCDAERGSQSIRPTGCLSGLECSMVEVAAEEVVAEEVAVEVESSWSSDPSWGLERLALREHIVGEAADCVGSARFQITVEVVEGGVGTVVEVARPRWVCRFEWCAGRDCRLGGCV